MAKPSSSDSLVSTTKKLKDQIELSASLLRDSERLLCDHHYQFSHTLKKLFGCTPKEVIESIRSVDPYLHDEIKKDPFGFLQNRLSLDNHNVIDEVVAGTLREHLSEWESGSSEWLLTIDKPHKKEIASVQKRRSRIKI